MKEFTVKSKSELLAIMETITGRHSIRVFIAGTNFVWEREGHNGCICGNCGGDGTAEMKKMVSRIKRANKSLFEGGK